ncbi:MAG: serine hydrolase [Rhodobacteraceae bacterium]|nr:serine hydrolase [Paracoccaceae bacterium]
MFAKALRVALGAVLVVVAALVGYLWIAPPNLLKVGTNYAAKIVCSNVFLAGRDAQEVLALDVQAPGHPLLKQVSVSVDESAGQVTARVFGFAAPAVSQYRPGLGCTNLHDATLSPASLPMLAAPGEEVWPQGNAVTLSQDPKLVQAMTDPALLGEGYRAALVVHRGQIIAESYADGFDADTPLLGWSMTKTLVAALFGTLEQAGLVSRDMDLTSSYPDWAQDDRADITLADMLAMSSGLGWNEGYGDVSDVTRMLYLVDDMAGFAASQPLVAPVGTDFIYSSGTSTALSRVMQNLAGDDNLSYPQGALFAPLGMSSAVLETDATDTFVGSSYMYATARDWARFAQFLLQGGQWDGQALLPEGYTDWMFAPAPASDGLYGKGQIWIESPGERPPFEDAVWMQGHDGQFIGIFPSRDLIVLRMGLTPSRLDYSSLPLAQAIIAALDG